MSDTSRRLLLWTGAIAFPIPLLIVLNLQMPDADSMRLFISLGVVAYCWWLAAVLLSVRPSWLDRSVGLPQIYAVHGMVGVFALVAAGIHRLNTFAPTQAARLTGDWAFWGSLVVLCYSVFFLSGWLTDRVPLLATVKRRLEIVFRHQLSVWIHRFNLVAIALIWLHVHLIDRVAQHFGFMLLFDTYTVAVLGTYVWKKWIAPDDYIAGVVQDNLALNPTTRSLVIRLNKTVARARPGDFYFVRFDAPGISREWHPFSASTASQDTLMFTIRQNGDFTRALANVPERTAVKLEGPFGQFDRVVKERPSDAPLVLVGMGAGVAPLLSLTAGHAHQRRIHLMWSVRNESDVYHRDLLREYQQRSEGRMTVSAQIGRFRRNHFSELLSAHEVQHGEYFIVGPNPAVLGTVRTLRRLGVSRGQIHHERLTM